MFEQQLRRDTFSVIINNYLIYYNYQQFILQMFCLIHVNDSISLTRNTTFSSGVLLCQLRFRTRPLGVVLIGARLIRRGVPRSFALQLFGANGQDDERVKPNYTLVREENYLSVGAR